MTDNVIWGTDFKAKPNAVVCIDPPDGPCFFADEAGNIYRTGAIIDTTPSDYTAPTDDCA